MNCMVSGSQAKSGIAVKTVYADFVLHIRVLAEKMQKIAFVKFYLENSFNLEYVNLGGGGGGGG